jgi:hypothetical protein
VTTTPTDFDPPEGFSKPGPGGALYSFAICDLCGAAIMVTLPGGFEYAIRHRLFHAASAPRRGVVLG